MWSDEILIFHHWLHMEQKWWFLCLFCYVIQYDTVGIVSLEKFAYLELYLLVLFVLIEIAQFSRNP